MKNLEVNSLGLMELDARELANLDGGLILVDWGRNTVVAAFTNCSGAIHEMGDFFSGINQGLKDASKYR